MQPLIYQGKQLKLHQRATCLLELLKRLKQGNPVLKNESVLEFSKELDNLSALTKNIGR